ncbi:MAG TPA: hypothetical protein VFS10_01455 [Pyrinomonadaceae bacterium]|nr:hypothetical protein [Pyrinomonadaceae bacterium]
MFKRFIKGRLRRALAAASIPALALAVAAPAAAQDASPATPASQNQTQPRQATPPATASDTVTQVAASPAAEKVAAKAVVEPLYGEYRGVKLGMSADEVRAKFGKPEEKSDEMDFFVFSDKERARVYYRDGKASAVIATYIGTEAEAPAPASVLGTEIEAKPDGSMYHMAKYPQAGYWVAYSRTPGDAPLVMITMQKTP